MKYTANVRGARRNVSTRARNSLPAQIQHEVANAGACDCVPFGPEALSGGSMGLDSRASTFCGDPRDLVFVFCCDFVVGTNIWRSMKCKIITEGLGRTEQFLSRSRFVTLT